MKKAIYLFLFTLIFFGNKVEACDGLTPTVSSNTYIGNGQYELTIEFCEVVSNGAGAAVHGILIIVNGANIVSVETPSLYGVTQGETIFPTINGPNEVEYGDWGNSGAPIFLDDGDPQECWTIVLIVDNSAATVDVYGSSSNDVIAPGNGMVSYNGAWACGTNTAVPPPVCDAGFTPPTICSGSTTPIDLDDITPSSGTWSGPGVNSGTGVFDPSGLSDPVSITFTIGDAGFNCSTSENVIFETVNSPILTDTTICLGDFAPLDGTVDPPIPPVTACTYSISLYDTWGDGWNGGSVTVLVDGVAVLTNITLASGSGPATFNFDVMPGDVITVNYSGGSFTSENHYTVFDAAGGSGSTLYASPSGSTPPGSQNVSNSCTGGAPASNCSYELVLSDSYGDGFNGADVDIYINGVAYLMNQTVASCGGAGNGPCDVSINIPVNDGDVILLNYSGGSFDSENTLYLYDNDGVLVNSINNPPDGNLGSGVTAVCPAPPTMDYSWSPPTDLSDPDIANPVASPTSTTVYTLTITPPNSSCTSTTSITITVDDCSLAVELKDFKGACENNETNLTWQTESESNSDRFDVGYSKNGIDYYIVGTVQAAGNSNEALYYSFDRINQENEIGYYRLTEIDVDGSSNFSDILAVKCSDNEVSAYMVNGIIVISSTHDVEVVRVLDMSGRVVYDGTSKNIDVSKNDAAMYFLEVKTTENSERLKVINIKF